MSDRDLAAQAAAGDRVAFGRLVQQHQSNVRAFLLRLSRGDTALADDLAQDAFMAAWRKLAQFRGTGTFRGWLMRIAYTRYLMEARRRKFEPFEDVMEPAEAVQTMEPDVRFDLERSMAKLSLGERSALSLCYALGYSNDEAAEILGVPVGTVKSHVLRGRKRLLAMMEVAS